jgi:hypothetical protein
MKKVIFSFWIFLFSLTLVYSQDTITIEKDLLNSHSRIQYWIDQTDLNGDSVSSADDAFETKLLQYTSKYPQTLKAHFDSLNKGMEILTSDDGKFRIYDWDDMQGGTMRYFDNVFQYKSGDKVMSCLLPHRDTVSEGPLDMLYGYMDLYTFKTGASTYYLATYVNIESSRDYRNGIKVFAIQNGMLNDTVHLLKTKTGLHNEIAYEWENSDKNSDHTIYFDKTTNTIYIPLVDDVTITNRYIKYRYTGNYFEKVEAGK